MRKSKKSPEIKYGIEITKPWSKEMYDHNEKVASEMKANLMHHWNLIVNKCPYKLCCVFFILYTLVVLPC